MQKIVYIVGPTGVGKTDLAFTLAKKFDGALISADSIQVYKGLDIVSGKDLPETAQYISLPQDNKDGINTGFYIDRSVPIFLLDVVVPTFPFSVSLFQEIVSKTIDYILIKNKLPIVVGGTGLYIKSLLDPIETVSIRPNNRLRKKLEKLSVSELQLKLPEEKLKTLNNSDRNNPRRLIRAIEVSTQDTELTTHDHKTDDLVIGLTCNMKMLKLRIDKRVEVRLKQGALDEAGKLFEIYDSLAPQIKDANGYKQLFSYLKGEMDLDEAIYRWKISEYHHAKNQMTWFRKYGNVKWFDIANKGYEKDIAASLKNFLS